VLAANGKKVCILTRGYGRENAKRHVLVSDGKTVFPSAAEAGDEALLLARKLQGLAAVVSDADRVSAGEGAIKHLGVDCFVLDDGFQHLRLARALNIVTIDATNPWGGGSLLPAGRLREPVNGLQRADCVVLTRTDQIDDVSGLVVEVDSHSGGRPVFLSQMKPVGIHLLGQTHQAEPPSRRVAAFCAVGNPRSFFAHLRREGYELALEKTFPDHHHYSQADLNTLINEAKRAGADSLITTAKDAVKLEPLNVNFPFYVLEIEIEIENGAELSRMILNVSGIGIKE
ncbi:MAG TPA: tetraacyldisaccharide 4'-kinase, partial [Pyrinomonadaceae bacterium]|nr:tetraacyldisaccharide 4'-kinase [Pyrinomonadaceae bacterium]